MSANSEGNVYKVRWKKKASGYSAWLCRVPKAKVSGKDERELSEALFEIAIDEFGDGEPCFDFDPPLPAESAEQKYFDPEWFVINSNEHFRTVGDRAALYSEGVCSYCTAGQGKRTDVPRVLDWVPTSDFAFIWQERPSAYIVTEKFLQFFSPVLGSQLRAMPCVPGKKTRKQFFELELAPEIPLTTHKNATKMFGVVCPSCKRESASIFVCPAVGKGLYTAVERTKVASMDRQGIVVAGGLTHRICINAELAKKLKASSGLKGVLLDRLVMLRADQLGTFKLAEAEKGYDGSTAR
jgi:hypothetical protein